MERKKYKFWLLILLGAMHTAGAIGLYLPVSRALFQVLTPFNLIFTFFVVFFYYRISAGFVLISALIILSAYVLEVAGVKTGFIFGNYSYGNTLGLKILDTPLLIGINWIMLIWATGSVAENLTGKNIILNVLMGATLMVVLDFFIEPVAMVLDFWDWEQGVVPLRNYLAWFVISVLFIGVFRIQGYKLKNKLASAIYIYQFLFFLLLYIIL